MHKVILHIDFNSYFATVEQQANPRLRGKPIGVTGGDRMERTVIGAASIEAKKFGVRTGMHLFEAQKLCPNIILVQGDSDKYLEVTKRFLTIIKDYSPYVEVFSIDEVFIELPVAHPRGETTLNLAHTPGVNVAKEIKSRVRKEIGEWMKCSIGISYNKLLAKLASNLQKPDGLVVIPNQKEAIKILDKIELNEVCGIGLRIKQRLNNMGVFSFKDLRKVPLEALLASYKSYGQILYNYARGIDERAILPFYKKEEVKSIGHRHTLSYDTNNPDQIKQLLIKLTELIARRLRAKKLVGKTVSCWYRYALNPQNPWGLNVFNPRGWIASNPGFLGSGMQTTVAYTSDGLIIFQAAWRIFHQIWNGDKIRMVGVSISNLKPINPQNLSLLPEAKRKEVILKAIDKINDKFGEFTLQRGTLIGSSKMKRMPNPFLADRRFKL